jgi:hypothetical protein
MGLRLGLAALALFFILAACDEPHPERRIYRLAPPTDPPATNEVRGTRFLGDGKAFTPERVEPFPSESPVDQANLSTGTAPDATHPNPLYRARPGAAQLEPR